jgi:hypothetical protein
MYLLSIVLCYPPRRRQMREVGCQEASQYAEAPSRARRCSNDPCTIGGAQPESSIQQHGRTMTAVTTVHLLGAYVTLLALLQAVQLQASTGASSQASFHTVSRLMAAQATYIGCDVTISIRHGRAERHYSIVLTVAHHCVGLGTCNPR